MKKLMIFVLSLLTIASGSTAFAFDPGAPNQAPVPGMPIPGTPPMDNQVPGNPIPTPSQPGDQNGSTANNGTINGTYSIVAVHSGKALDVYDWGKGDGTNIVQWDFWGGEVQQFKISSVDGIWHRITPVISTGQAIDVADCSTNSGANIQTWSYWGGDCQQFRFQSAGNGVWRIIARNSGLCLDVLNASFNDGANVIQYTCTSGAENQMFELVRR